MLLPVLLPSTDHLLQNRKGVINDSAQSESMHATDFPNYVIWVFFLFFTFQ